LFFRRRKYQNKPNAKRINTKGTATPMLACAPVERPLDGWAVGDEDGVEDSVATPNVADPPLVTPMTSVIAADLLAVNVDVYPELPEGTVVVTKNVAEIEVANTAKTTVAVPSLPSG
jgi:hypothetical protein